MGNLNILIHDFNVLETVQARQSTLCEAMGFLQVLCYALPVPCKHLDITEHGSRNPSLDAEVVIQLYVLSAEPFTG